MATVEEAVRETLQNYTNACNSGDLEAYKATLTEDVEWIPPDSPPISGRDAVGEWAREGFFDSFDLHFQSEFARLVEAGSEVFAPGGFSLKMTPKAGGEPSIATGSFFNIFRDDGDGVWKYCYAIFNFDEPQDS